MITNFKLAVFPILLSLFIFAGCHKDIPEPSRADCSLTCQYLVLGHIYEGEDTVDKRIETADLSQYAQIWLGGDLCSETTREASTLDYLDDLFDLSSDQTHWAVGNHDLRNGQTDLITDHTKRPLFYTQNFDDITIMVLNTNYSDSEECDSLALQTELIRSVCDTITESSHLVVLMHHVVWGGVEIGMNVSAYANINFSGLSFTCPPFQRFETVVYPELLQVQERGIPVICISGDFGQEAVTYEWTTSEGITFLGTGITSEIGWNEQWPTAGYPDSVLILQHDLTQKSLTWEFIDLEDI